MYIYDYYNSGHFRMTFGDGRPGTVKEKPPVVHRRSGSVGWVPGSDGVESHQVVPELEPDAAGGALPVLGHDDLGDVAGVLLARVGL